MIYSDIYWNAALFYAAGVIGFWLVMWKLTTYVPWRPIRWWLTWLYLCVVLTPWQGSDPENYYAPAIIVAAFDFLDGGFALAMLPLKPMINALVLGSAAIVLLAVVLKVKSLKENEQQASEPETAEVGE